MAPSNVKTIGDKRYIKPFVCTPYGLKSSCNSATLSSVYGQGLANSTMFGSFRWLFDGTHALVTDKRVQVSPQMCGLPQQKYCWCQRAEEGETRICGHTHSRHLNTVFFKRFWAHLSSDSGPLAAASDSAMISSVGTRPSAASFPARSSSWSLRKRYLSLS